MSQTDAIIERLTRHKELQKDYDHSHILKSLYPNICKRSTVQVLVSQESNIILLIMRIGLFQVGSISSNSRITTVSTLP